MASLRTWTFSLGVWGAMEQAPGKTSTEFRKPFGSNHQPYGARKFILKITPKGD